MQRQRISITPSGHNMHTAVVFGDRVEKSPLESGQGMFRVYLGSALIAIIYADCGTTVEIKDCPEAA